MLIIRIESNVSACKQVKIKSAFPLSLSDCLLWFLELTVRFACDSVGNSDREVSKLRVKKANHNTPQRVHVETTVFVKSECCCKNKGKSID